MSSLLLHCYYECILHRCSRLPEKIPSNCSRCVRPKLIAWTNVTPLFSHKFFIWLMGRAIYPNKKYLSKSKSSSSDRKSTQVLLDPKQFPLLNILEDLQQQGLCSLACPSPVQTGQQTDPHVEAYRKRVMPAFTFPAHPIQVPRSSFVFVHG